MSDINESISNDNLIILQNATFNKLVRIQSLLKKESSLKKLCN